MIANVNRNNNSKYGSTNKTKVQQQQPPSSLLQRLNPFSSKATLDSPETGGDDGQSNLKKLYSDEYQGVKNLKQYWDKKISATKLTESEKRTRVLGTKSATLDNKTSHSLSNVDTGKPSTNSLNRKTSETIVPDNSKKFKSDPSVVLRDNQKNTCKSKSTESVTKRNSCELSPLKENLNVVKRFRPDSLNLPINRHSVSTLHFPAISTTESGGKIHWAKREEIFGLRRTVKKEVHPLPDKQSTTNNSTVNSNKSKMSIKDNDTHQHKKEIAHNVLSHDKTNSNGNKCKQTDKSHCAVDNGSRVTTANKLLCASLSTGSIASNTDSTSRKAARKFSFKTNTNMANTAYHKKVSTNGGSKVKALTQRFNQLIQSDASLLEEVKRGGIVVHKTGGNVYKIKETADPVTRKRNSKKTDDSTDETSSIGKPVKKKTSVRRKVSTRLPHQRASSSVGNVKATILLFEPKSAGMPQAKVKPKVPDKSEQVLEKTKELKNKKSDKSKVSKNVKVEMEIVKPNQHKSIKNSTTIPCVLEKLDEVPEIVETVVPKDKIMDTPKVEEDSSKVCKEKSKYSKIYDKIRFRSSFFQHKKLDKGELVSSEPVAQHIGKSVQNFEEIILSSDDIDINELHSMEDRVNSLSKSVCNLTTNKKHYEDVAFTVKPNDSFLFRTTSKSSFSSTYDFLYKTSAVEAINSVLINKTQSMDDGKFPHSQNVSKQVSLGDTRTYIQMLEEADELIKKFKKKDRPPSTTDDGYELYAENPPGLAAEAVNVEVVNSFLMKIPDSPTRTEEAIYQSLQEFTKDKLTTDSGSIDSYESMQPYEQVPDENSGESIERENHVHRPTDDQYEVCDPPEPPPRVIETPASPTKDLPPQLPSPKRMTSSKTVTYERVRYEQLPPRPPKSPQPSAEVQYVPLPPRNSFSEHNLRVLSVVSINQESERQGVTEPEPDYYDENIYDTIKNGDNKSISSNCYESLSSKVNNKASVDTISLISNCYESISLKHDYRPNHVLRNADSISTLSSDHKTNSLYGTALGMVNTPPSDRSSDASDDWIDVSDEEAETKQSFIVVRERTKPHKSPEWSRKIRDHLVNQQQIEGFYDDSDHHYESLYSIEQKADLERGSLTNQANNDSPVIANNFSKAPSNAHDDYEFSDFSDNETDDEKIEETKKNDSGVDISRKLPDPPKLEAKTQVYALMQKMKNFGSLTKNEITKGLSKIAATKKKSTTTSPMGRSAYENTNLATGRDGYQNINFDSERKKSSTQSLRTGTFDPYENTEFHSPRIPTTPEVMAPSPSSPLPASSVATTPTDPLPPEKVSRKKSKTGKSFKSKFRKSVTPDSSLNLGSSFNGTRSTFYVSDSMDVDSGIFTSEKQTSIEDMNGGGTSVTAPTSSNLNNSTLVETGVVAPERRRSKQTPDLTKRQSSLGVRPNNPPPPPPPSVPQTEKKLLKSKRIGTTSWYAECGVFKSDTLKNEGFCADGKRGDRNVSSPNSCWYSEAGLYQTSGVSVASSSGSSGVSTGGECGPGDDNSHSMFLNEPLYQIYSAAKLESITQDIDHSDGYEEIGGRLNSEMEDEEEKRSQRPTALQLVEPNNGPSRTLWCEIPEVINSQILMTLTQNEKRLQEAKFEILTSEASYLKSLNLLKSHFMNHPAFRDQQILSSADRKTLFSYIIPVQECSDRLLCDLENHWQDSIMLMGLSDSIYKHAEKHFHVYVTYCEHQGKLDRTLKRLRDNKGTFTQSLEKLELDPVCCSLSLYSFLMLPMQRITRLPLLIDAVLSKLTADDDEFEGWKLTLAILNKIVAQCNEAAKRCQQMMELETISRQIEFPSHIRPLAIMPVGVVNPGDQKRRLIKSGELTQMVWRGEDAKLTFGKKFTKSSIYGFLFTDLLVLTKKKGDSSFLVFDHCPRSLLTVSSGDVIPQLPTKDVASIGKHLMIMTLLENYEGKTVEMILSCPSETDRQRWLQATEPPQSDNPDEKLYEQWDCPQVVAKHTYQALQPDEISLDPGDVVNVFRKMADGWYHGERLRDGIDGWFPGNYTEEVASAHVRARNLKQRYRLLTFTANYLESQKQK